MSYTTDSTIQPLDDSENVQGASRHDIDQVVKMAEAARLATDRDCLVRALRGLVIYIDPSADVSDRSIEAADRSLSYVFPKGGAFAEIQGVEQHPGIKTIHVELYRAPRSIRTGGLAEISGFNETSDDEEDDESDVYMEMLLVFGPTLAAEVHTNRGCYCDDDYDASGTLEIHVSLNPSEMQDFIRKKAENFHIDCLEEKMQRIFESAYKVPQAAYRAWKP